MQSKEKQREIINNFFINQGFDVNENINLFESGRIDSMGIVELLVYIEKELSISIDASKMIADNFKTINSILRLIQSENE